MFWRVIGQLALANSRKLTNRKSVSEVFRSFLHRDPEINNLYYRLAAEGYTGAEVLIYEASPVFVLHCLHVGSCLFREGNEELEK